MSRLKIAVGIAAVLMSALVTADDMKPCSIYPDFNFDTF